MAFDLPPLPYSKSALEPFLSERTLEFHHGKHHKAYVDKLNELVGGTNLATKSLEAIVAATVETKRRTEIFNNAAQAWNHAFFWKSMRPRGGGSPSGELAQGIQRDFGSFDKFRKQFTEAAVGQFGSGWAWLVLDNGELKIVKSADAMTPIAYGQTPLLACDVWEHAYSLDYQNRRPDFVAAFLDHLANWDAASVNLHLADKD